MRLSVILLLYRSRPWMEGCLRTLVPALRAAGGDCGVVLVDQGSDDGAAAFAEEFLRREEVPFLTLMPGKNLGVAGGRNLGARAPWPQPPDWLLFLDTDTELPAPAVLQELLAAAAAHPRAALLGPKLVTGDPAAPVLQRSARHFPRPLDLAANWLGRKGLPGFSARARRYHLDDFDFSRARPVPWLAGACQLLRRDAFDSLGGFAPEFFYGLEETDHCLRLWLAGHEVWFIPCGPVHHHTQRLSSRSLRFLLLHARSALRYFARHRGVTAAAERRHEASLARPNS
jgi:N-acetylglucosaminyl-diphospho-decaprenol L-rhamnosyltransferase